MQAIIKFFSSISEGFERSNRERFVRWSAFLGRKMFMGLVAMLLLTGAFMILTMGALLVAGVDAMKALGTELWTGYCMTLGALFGAATATNVLEHQAKAKVDIAKATPAPAEVTQ